MKYSPARQDGGTFEGDQSTFTGRAILGRFLGGGKGGKTQVGTVTVTFEPGSRTYWHSHEDGQVLIASHGHGVVENRDGDRHLLHPGDIVWAPPGEVHWHGATPDSTLVQTAVSLGEARWAEEVPEDHYRAAFPDLPHSRTYRAAGPGRGAGRDPNHYGAVRDEDDLLVFIGMCGAAAGYRIQ